MTNLAWTPWHQAVRLRDDLRTGELSLAIFAADLYDVAMQKGRRLLYEDSAQFFALTYPTYNLRELSRDVVLRLAGKSDKAIRQLELTYGGGKTHALRSAASAGAAGRARVRPAHRHDASPGPGHRAPVRQARRGERHGGAGARG